MRRGGEDQRAAILHNSRVTSTYREERPAQFLKAGSKEITLDHLGELVEEGAWRGLQQPPSSGKWKLSQDWRHSLGFPSISDAGKTRGGWILGLEQPV